jgi:uncharacterized membrane protein YqjE
MPVSRITPRLGALHAPSLGELLERLAGELRQLLDQTLALMGLELKEQLADLLRRTMLLAVGVLVGTLGVAFLIAALAIWLGARLGSVPGGFAVVGGAVTLVGALLMAAMARRLRHQRLGLPATANELRRNVAWMKNTR